MQSSTFFIDGIKLPFFSFGNGLLLPFMHSKKGAISYLKGVFRGKKHHFTPFWVHLSLFLP
jgi:hypothetical protein